MKQCLGRLCGVVVSVPNHLLLSQKQQYHTISLLFLFVSHLCHFLSHTNILILLQHKLPPTIKHKHNLQTSHLYTNNKKTTTISFYPGHHLNLPHLVMQLLLKLLSSHGGRRKGDMGAGGKAKDEEERKQQYYYQADSEIEHADTFACCTRLEKRKCRLKM